MQLSKTPDDGLNDTKSIEGRNYTLHIRPFNTIDLEWWGSYGITLQILQRFGTMSVEKKCSISKTTNNPYTIHSKADSLIFAYPYSNTCIKMYQPRAEKKHKFHYLDPEEKDKEFVYGLEQLTDSSMIVVWTGGEKDVMSLASIGLNAITGTSETGKISNTILKNLKAKGFEVIILFDNDQTGMIMSEKFSKEFGIKRALLPTIPNDGKDVSDYLKLKLPIEEILLCIENAEVVLNDSQIEKSINSEIKLNTKFFNELSIVKLTESEFAYDIWVFGFKKDGGPMLKGIYRYGVVKLLADMGFFKRCRENNTYLFIREEANIIEEVEIFMMNNALQNYIERITDNLKFYFVGNFVEIPKEKLLEMFLRQSHTIFNRIFLTQLSNHDKPILKDKRESAFFFFKNQVVEVTTEGLKYNQYSELAGTCIWRSHIKVHDFDYIDKNQDCHFAIFIKNVTNGEAERGKAFVSVIGYLLHNHILATSGQAIVANDEEITDHKNPMGGTGKGLFANALKQMRDVVKIDGKKFDPEDKFKFQNISDSTQIVWLDDTKQDFDFSIFHSCLTDGWSIEKKYQDQFFIKREDSPKTFICSNTVIIGGGTTNKRRQVTIEFSNHYSKQIKTGVEEPIRSEHGCTFFDLDDWNQDEWNKFYSYMLDCVCYYLKNGLQHYEHKNLELNRLRQSTSEEFCEWVSSKEFQTGIEYETGEHFKEFRNLYYGENSEFAQRGFTNWLQRFAASRKWNFKAKRSNSVSKFLFTDMEAVRQPVTLF